MYIYRFFFNKTSLAINNLSPSSSVISFYNINFNLPNQHSTKQKYARTSEYDVILKRKIVIAFIKVKHFKTVTLNNTLILEEQNYSGDENDVILKGNYAF